MDIKAKVGDKIRILRDGAHHAEVVTGQIFTVQATREAPNERLRMASAIATINVKEGHPAVYHGEGWVFGEEDYEVIERAAPDTGAPSWVASLRRK